MAVDTSQLPAGDKAAADDAVRVLIVDDSAVVRGLTKRWIDEEADLTVIGSASNGVMAIQQAGNLLPDVAILDIEMPQMDGISALPEILKAAPGIKVVMASTLTARNAEVSLKALALGAADYVAKPQASAEMQDPGGFRRELIEKVRALASARRMRPRGEARQVSGSNEQNKVKARPEGGLYGAAPIVTRQAGTRKPDVIAIGSSTGGPQALQKVMASLASLGQPILITQHMPPTFTTVLADHLSTIQGITCTEAKDGTVVEAGQTYLAPGDYHMTVSRRGTDVMINLNQDPPENFCRPAVDPMFRSLAETYGGGVFAVVLTGMGHDGLNGGEAIVAKGGTLIAQDEASSVVWGMPGAVATGGLCSAVLPLTDIGPAVARVANGGKL